MGDLALFFSNEMKVDFFISKIIEIIDFSCYFLNNLNFSDLIETSSLNANYSLDFKKEYQVTLLTLFYLKDLETNQALPCIGSLCKYIGLDLSQATGRSPEFMSGLHRESGEPGT